MRFSGRKRGKKLDTLESASVAKYVLYGMKHNRNRQKFTPERKKEAILQSLRCLGEKIRTSGLLNPIQKISFAFYAVFCLYFRISPDKCDDILNNHPYKGKPDHVLTTHINY